MIIDLENLDAIFIWDEGSRLVDVIIDTDDPLYKKYIKRVKFLDVECIQGGVFVRGGIVPASEVDWEDFME